MLKIMIVYLNKVKALQETNGFFQATKVMANGRVPRKFAGSRN